MKQEIIKAISLFNEKYETNFKYEDLEDIIYHPNLEGDEILKNFLLLIEEHGIKINKQE